MNDNELEAVLFILAYCSYLALLHWAIYPVPLGGWNPQAWEDYGAREWP